MKYGIYVGSNHKAAKVAAAAIKDILNADTGDEVKRIALRVLEKATKSPDYTNISNVSITAPTTYKVHEREIEPEIVVGETESIEQETGED
jgi:flavodoxin